MSTSRVFLSTVALSLLLAGFFGYMTVRPTDIRAYPDSRKTLRGMATLSFFEGDVEVRHPGESWRPARRGETLRAGDAVRTGGDGRAELVLHDLQGRLRLDRETWLVLREDGTNGFLAGGRVLEGSVWARAENRRLVLHTPAGETSVHQGVFRVHAPDADRVRVEAYSGEVGVGEGAKNGRRVVTGQALAFTPGRAPVLQKIDLRGDWSDGWLDRAETGETQSAENVEARTYVRSLKRDLRDINPDIYLSVEVELTGLDSEIQVFRVEEVALRKIRIRARAWDRLKPGEKVDLLNETFTLLKRRYPNITRSVVLEFDDDRPNLELKYSLTLEG